MKTAFVHARCSLRLNPEGSDAQARRVGHCRAFRGANDLLLRDEPVEWAKANECFDNCIKQAELCGGSILHGRCLPVRLFLLESTCCRPHLPPACSSSRATPAWRFAMGHLSGVVTLIPLLTGAAADPVPSVTGTINRGFAFLAKDNLGGPARLQVVGGSSQHELPDVRRGDVLDRGDGGLPEAKAALEGVL